MVLSKYIWYDNSKIKSKTGCPKWYIKNRKRETEGRIKLIKTKIVNNVKLM